MKRVFGLAIIASVLMTTSTACASRGAGDIASASPEHAEHPADSSMDAAEHAAMHEPHQAQGRHQEQHAAPDASAPTFTEADVRFMQDMIGHHEQALVMAAMIPTHGAGEDILKLGEKIDISQRDEIRLMKLWLTRRNQPVPGEQAHAVHTPGMLMPGMLTPEQMAQLDAARGREFERLFLTFMIQHHEGALEMVDTLFDSPGAGQDSDIFRFATDVMTDQMAEIDVMIYMLDTVVGLR